MDDWARNLEFRWANAVSWLPASDTAPPKVSWVMNTDPHVRRLNSSIKSIQVSSEITSSTKWDFSYIGSGPMIEWRICPFKTFGNGPYTISLILTLHSCQVIHPGGSSLSTDHQCHARQLSKWYDFPSEDATTSSMLTSDGVLSARAGAGVDAQITDNVNMGLSVERHVLSGCRRPPRFNRSTEVIKIIL